MSSSSSAFSSKRKKSRSSSIRSAPSRSCKWSFSKRLSRNGMPSRNAPLSASGPPPFGGGGGVSRGGSLWGRLAMRRRRSAWLLLRDAGVNALIVAQITIVHGYSSRVVRNTLARWMSLASCAARATFVAPLVAQKGLQRVEERGRSRCSRSGSSGSAPAGAAIKARGPARR